MAHEDIGPEHMTLPADTGGPGYLSSFAQVALQYNDFDWTRSGIAGAKPLPFEPSNTSVFEPSIAWAWQGEPLECALLARAELFERETLERWLERHFTLLCRLSGAQS